MTTQSTSDMPGTDGMNTPVYKVYLAEADGGFDFNAKLKEAQEALEAAQLAYQETIEACHDQAAAQAAADKTMEAAERAIAIKEEARNFIPSPEELEESNELERVGSNAHRLLNYAAVIADGHWNGRSTCNEGMPMAGAKPLLPNEILASSNTGALDSAQLKSVERQDTVHADMRDPSHPDHSRFEAIYAGISRIDQGRGSTSDQSNERLAAALTVQSKIDGLETVRHVAMSSDGTRAFAIDTQDPTSPLANRSIVDVAAAARQPMEMSNEKTAQVNNHISMQRPDLTGTEPDVPTRNALRMI